MKESSIGKFGIKYEHFKDDLLFCIKCENYKEESCFSNRKDLSIRNYKSYDCRECASIARKNDYIKIKERKLKSLNTLDGYLKTVIQHAKHRGLEFDITIDDLIDLYKKQKGLCFYTKQKLTHILGKGKIHTNISLDRIDNSKGYIKGNIQLTTRVINIMKNDSTESEFINLCKLVSINN